MGSYRYRSLIEGLSLSLSLYIYIYIIIYIYIYIYVYVYMYTHLIEALCTLNSSPVVSFNVTVTNYTGSRVFRSYPVVLSISGVSSRVLV